MRKKTQPVRHGYARKGMVSSEYSIWSGIKQRCGNEKNSAYLRYGGKGICVCSRWVDSFDNFIEDMGNRPTSRHTLERIDNSKGYAPDNCKWATYTEQNNNRSNGRFFTAYGETKTLAQWSRILEVPRGRLESRLRYGWSDHDILFMPSRYRMPT